MADKKKAEKPKLKIETRVPQKRGIFDNLGKGKQENVKHPFSEIINFPSEHPRSENSDIRDEESKTSETINPGHPNNHNSDVLDNQSRTSEPNNLGQTAVKISDTKTPDIESRTSEKVPISDTKTSENISSDIRESEKAERKRYDSAYEQKRKTNNSIDRMNLRPHIEIGKKIRVFCAEQGWELTHFLEIAGVKFIENFGHPSDKNSDTKTPLDDRRLRTLYKTKPRIIHLYSAYAENSRWSVNDDAKASALNEVDLRIVELGILQTLGNRKTKGKINSFGYFLPEIENFLEIEMPEEGIEAMLQINRKSFQRLTGKTIDLSFLNETAE